MIRGFSSGPFRLLFILFLLAACAGCATSAPSRFYQLSSLKNEERPAKKLSGEKSVIVAVGPVRIPDYLDRPQIVTRSGENKIKVADFDRWAGSLDQDISRVLVENLSNMLSPEYFYITTWVSAAQPPSYRVEVNIIRFEGVLGASVQTKAQWALLDKDGALLVRRDFFIKEAVSNNTYEAFVEALSRTLGALSRDIADEISDKNKTQGGQAAGRNVER